LPLRLRSGKARVAVGCLPAIVTIVVLEHSELVLDFEGSGREGGWCVFEYDTYRR